MSSSNIFDPNWVARPRNAFIIFRCEYAKQNARGRHSSVDKSMSKRAADAWKALSKGEKDLYRKLAEREKVEHAIAHPGYRYKPKRRIASQRRHHQHREDSSDDDYSSSPVASPAKRLPSLAPTLESHLEIVPSSPAGNSHDLLHPSEIQYLADHVSSLEIGSYTPSSSPVSYQTSPLATVASSPAGDVPIAMEQISSVPQQPQPSASSWSPYPSYHIPESNVFWNPSQQSMTNLNDSDSAFDSSPVHSYHVGLSTQVQESTADYMIFGLPVEEQRIFERSEFFLS